ncbi:unnamed protein product [Ectocarpus sp. 6 AP-2014]
MKVAYALASGAALVGTSDAFVAPAAVRSPLQQQRTSSRPNVVMAATAEKPATSKEAQAVPGGVMTLSRYMLDQARINTDYQDLEQLMGSIQYACKTIANLVSRAGISDLTGLQGDGGSVNVQGEEQKKLDVISNDVLKNALRSSGKLGVIASEEEDTPVLVEEAFNSKFVAVFDPLDGSSNIDAAISTGTIFGIFEETEECIVDDDADMDEASQVCLEAAWSPQPAQDLAAWSPGYCMYSSSTILVFTMGDGVNGFTLDPQIGEFVMTHPNIQVPKRGKIYSFNEANSPDWPENLQTYVTDLKNGDGESGEKYSSRYIGSMVGDVHRTLLYGGIFGYPGDINNPNGKLRLLYEGAPMAFICEQAGGMATTGTQRVMDINPEKVHQRVPTYLGSAEDVTELINALKKEKAE